MIPKIIHICWLGDDEPNEDFKLLQYSWVKHLWANGYTLHIWDKSSIKKHNLMDSPFFKNNYNKQKYAFCADYIRFYALYTEGGIYIDYDVDVTDSFDRILHLKTFFGLECVKSLNEDFTINDHNFEAAIVGAEKNDEFSKNVIDLLDKIANNKNYLYGYNIIIPDVCNYILSNKNFKIVNSIKEAEECETKKIIPLFNYPKFDRCDADDNTNQDYGICNHHFFNSWL